jgi:hypothetical protein
VVRAFGGMESVDSVLVSRVSSLWWVPVVRFAVGRSFDLANSSTLARRGAAALELRPHRVVLPVNEYS